MLPVLSCLQRQTFPDSSQGHRLWSKNFIFFNEDDAKTRRLFQIISIEKSWLKIQEMAPPYSFISSTIYVCIYLSACLLLSPITGKTTDPCHMFLRRYKLGIQHVSKRIMLTVKIEWRTAGWVLDIHLCISFSMINLFTPKSHTFIFILTAPIVFFSPGNHSCWQTRTWSQAWDSPRNSSWIRKSSSYWLQPARNPPRNSCEDYSGQKDPGRDTAFLCLSVLSDERQQFWWKIPKLSYAKMYGIWAYFSTLPRVWAFFEDRICIRIRIKVKSRIRVRIRIRIKVMRIHNTGLHWEVRLIKIIIWICIRIGIRVISRIRIRIRIRIKVMRSTTLAYAEKFF